MEFFEDEETGESDGLKAGNIRQEGIEHEPRSFEEGGIARSCGGGNLFGTEVAGGWSGGGHLR